MLVVRKEGKAHNRYNSFRSAFELLESVGREPQDCFDEREEDLPPLQKMKRHIMKHHQESMEQLHSRMKQCMEQRMKQQREITAQQQALMQKQIDNLKSENEILRFKLNDVLK